MPSIVVVATAAVKVVGSAVLAVGITTVAPWAIGFGSGGVMAGSLASAWQASIGNVAAGSLFSILQSAGVVGLAVVPKMAIAGVGAVGGIIATLIGYR